MTHRAPRRPAGAQGARRDRLCLFAFPSRSIRAAVQVQIRVAEGRARRMPQFKQASQLDSPTPAAILQGLVTAVTAEKARSTRPAARRGRRGVVVRLAPGAVDATGHKEKQDEETHAALAPCEVADRIDQLPAMRAGARAAHGMRQLRAFYDDSEDQRRQRRLAPHRVPAVRIAPARVAGIVAGFCVLGG